MKKLKTILHCNYLYYALTIIAVVLSLTTNNTTHHCVSKNIINDDYIIEQIINKDNGMQLYLKGKERVVATYYLDQNKKTIFLNTYELGDKVKIAGEEKILKNNTIENTFNYKKYLYNQKIYHQIKVNDIKVIKKNKKIIYKIKNYLIKRQENLEKTNHYTNSLIFGNNKEIEEEIMESYRNNGISHLFAISGLHISLFIVIISKLLKRIGIKNKTKYIILILFLLFYMFLTNFSMSVMRSAIFAILIIVNKTLKTEIKLTNLLLLTLIIILLINPLYFYNIGLQYSFLITYFLIKNSDFINRSPNKIIKLLKISVIAFLVSYPIAINNFYEVNFLSIFYNIFFVPFVSCLLLPFTLITYILPIFENVLYLLIKIIEFISQLIEQIPIFTISMCKLNVTMILTYYVILCLVLSQWKNKNKKGTTLLITFYVINFLMPLKQENYVEFLDVSQGDSIVIHVNKNTTLIDTGGIVMSSDNQYTYQLSKRKILPYLKSHGIRKINNLILTHGDFDHMGEAIYLINNIKVDKVVLNNDTDNKLEKKLIKELKNKKIKYQKGATEIPIGKNKLKFLNTSLYDNENDNSNVIYLNYNNSKFMFMGDASMKREQDILEKYNPKNIDILKVGHHGSKTGTSQEFVNKINPKYAIISVGENNRYKHPNKEVLETLKNTKIYRTDKHGSIRIKLNKNGYKIKTYTP